MTTNVAQQRTSKGEGIIGQILSGRNLRQMLVEQQKARKAAGLAPILQEVSGFHKQMISLYFSISQRKITLSSVTDTQALLLLLALPGPNRRIFQGS